MDNKEIWKDIANYEGLYQISNLGRVKSLNYRKTNKSEYLRYLRLTNKVIALLNKMA